MSNSLPHKDTITASQLVILAFTGLFSPLIWQMPHAASKTAGAAAVFSPFFAIIPLGVLWFIAGRLIKSRRNGEGLAQIILRCLGKVAGSVVCGIYLLWFIFYAAVSLRSSSERFLSTIFPGGSLWVFMPVTLFISFIGACGRTRSLAGSAQIFLRMILIVLGIIFLFTLPKIDIYNLLPYTEQDLLPAALGGLSVANAISPAVYILFLADRVDDGHTHKKTLAGLLIVMLIISFLMIITIIGNFGVSFTNTMQNPFFTMIRNISIFNVVERWEAMVVAMWVLTDFIFISVLLSISRSLTHTLLPIKRRVKPLCVISVAVFLLGMFMEKSAFSFSFIAQTVCPAISAVMSFVIPLCIVIVGRVRKVL